MRNGCFYLLLFLLTGLDALYAQPGQVQFTRGDITRGLSHNQVNCFYRDPQGFMWIGTMNGLNRYDGYAYRIYTSNSNDSNSLDDNYIEDIFPFPGGKILVITRLGGNLYDLTTDRFTPYSKSRELPEGLPDTLPQKCLMDDAHRYWMLFRNRGVYCLEPGSQRARPVKLTGITGTITDLSDNNDGTLAMIDHTGLICRIDGRNGKLLSTSTALSKMLQGRTSAGFSLYTGSRDQTWIWMQDDPAGAFLLRSSTQTVIPYTAKPGDPSRLQHNNVTGITSDPSGYIWITTDPGGLHLVHPMNGQLHYVPNNPEDPYSVSQSAIVSIYKDPQQLIWLGTYKKGLNYFNPNLPRLPVEKHDPTNPGSLPYNDLNDIIEDSQGNLWMAGNGGGLLYYDRTSKVYKRYMAGPGSISSNVVVSLCLDHEGKLWIGSYYGGLDCFYKGKFTSYRPDPRKPSSLADDNVWEIYEDSRHRLWVGTLRGGVHLYRPETQDFIHFRRYQDNSVKSDYNSVTLEDYQGNIWFGTSLGIDILQASDGRFRHLAANKDQPGSLSNENIYSLLEDTHKRMWVGTRDGLNLYLPETRSFLSFTRKDGLPDNTIINILEDNQGALWVSTHNGLSQIKVTGSGKDVSITCRNYTELNNLQGRDFNENAALKTSRGELIFGGANGYNIFNPTALAGAPTAGQVHFTGFDLFNNPVLAGETYNGRVVLPKSITTTNEVTLAYNQNVFSVEFAALDFAHTEKTRFAYWLEGFNPDWLYTDAGIRKAHYTNLNPGLYRLRVRAFDNGRPGAQEAVLTIRILPPWWYSTPAYIAYAVLLIALLMAARKLILVRARARFQLEQERREAKRMHELDELKLEFITNISHEFRTPLSLILAPLEKLQKLPASDDQQKHFGLMQRNVKCLLNLVNQLLDFRKMDVQEHRFDAQQGDLISFTRDVCEGFTEVAERKHISFEFSSELAQLSACFDADKLEKVLLNLLSNAYKFTRDGGKVQVTVRLEETGLGSLDAQAYCLIAVSDTGIGMEAKDLPLVFNRFHRNSLPDTMVNPGSGIGLALVKEFVELHGGTVTVTSVPEKGSCFTVALPIRKENNDLAPVPYTPHAVEIADSPTELIGNRPGNRPLILVVEDHMEFRHFLVESLQAHYRVLAAENGAVALTRIQQQVPNLVISDVMMPVMDGLELAAKLKKNPVTASIPLLLLTARNTEEHQLEGLMTGANDYLVKPFRFELLLQKIRNQLKEQRRKPVIPITVSPTQPSAPTAEADWLQQLMGVVEAHMSNPAFSVEQLAREVHLSRAGLYKKLIGLTGKTPIAFILEVRLARACQLLKQRQLTVAEIAYEVGFSDPKYFSRTFKKLKGVLPTAYSQHPYTATGQQETNSQDTGK